MRACGVPTSRVCILLLLLDDDVGESELIRGVLPAADAHHTGELLLEPSTSSLVASMIACASHARATGSPRPRGPLRGGLAPAAAAAAPAAAAGRRPPPAARVRVARIGPCRSAACARELFLYHLALGGSPSSSLLSCPRRSPCGARRCCARAPSSRRAPHEPRAVCHAPHGVRLRAAAPPAARVLQHPACENVR